jgi:hypothetical protein
VAFRAGTHWGGVIILTLIGAVIGPVATGEIGGIFGGAVVGFVIGTFVCQYARFN